MLEQATKILIVGPSWVGDMVMAQSLCIDIKQRNPDATIDMLAPQWTAAMTDRMPEVNKLIASDFKHGKLGLGERWRLGKALREQAYTHAIVLPNSLKSALVPALAKIPQRIGFIGEQRWGLLNDARKLDKQALPMTVQRFVALGRERGAPPIALEDIPAPALKADARQARSLAESLGLSLTQPVLALAPGAEFGPSKQWPSEHYANAAKHFLQQGWQIWLLGSDNDLATCNEINAALDHKGQLLAGRTSLTDAVDLLSLAQLVFSNDSGLMHIAAGLNVPLVAAYGSTDPGHTPPLSQNHRIAQISLDCSPCFKRSCPLEHHDCMRKLDVDQVLSLAQELQT